MKFERVRLENFKCYADADLRLDRGVTVIHGLNGSGKSSLLEACFFALYGARALDATLDEVVTIGADDATVELWFEQGGGSYHIERRVRVSDDRASTAKCVLEAPEATYEGARDVREHVAELLRMDHEAFVNCAYVRQGEVNKLINASPGERQDMIDDLLQLGKLEDYRERASKARLGVKHVLDNKEGELDGLDEQITAKEDSDLHERLNAAQSRRNEVVAKIENYESQRENAVQTREQAQDVLDEYEAKRDRLDDLAAEIDELTETIGATERERERLGEQVRELKAEADAEREQRAELLTETELEGANAETVTARIDDLEARDEEIRGEIEEHRLDANEQGNRAETLREKAADLESRAAEKREQADELEADLAATREKIADRSEKVETITDEIEAKREQFDDAPVDPDGADAFRDSVADDLGEVREREAELEATLDNARESLAEAEALLDEGKCPECGQPVEESPHVESIDEDRERVAELEAALEDVREERDDLEAKLERAEALVETANEIQQLETNRENVEQLIAEQDDGLDETETEIEQLRADADDLDTEAEEAREAAGEADEAAQEHREAIGECNQQRGEVRESIETLEAIETATERIGEIDDEIERLRDQRANKDELNEERRERLADKREAKADLEAEFDESAVESARGEKERAADYIEQVDAQLADLRDERDELQGTIGGIENEIDELEALRERRDGLAATVDRLDSLYAEAEQLQEMYGQLRAELRQRNVESLERMLNETFDLVYQNDSYSRIELDGEYELTVYQKDGEPLDPEQLSGGERALFNLSLRCAIYRLLAEGIEGSAPMPPLILDEPTVFLDSGHVSQLVELVGSMREMGVDQIVVVSHDEELVGAAQDLVRVEKDATSNRSTVRREEADPEAVLAAGDD